MQSTLSSKKVAIVTGAAGGIGEAVARELAKSGMFVALMDKEENAVNTLEADMKKEGLQVAAYPLDICDRPAVEETVKRIEENDGPIEALINVAGVMRMGTVDSLKDEDWDEAFAVNSTGVFILSRAVSRRMIPRERGSIVTVGSNAAFTPRISLSAYAASKAAATMFTKCLGLELAKYNIRCNIVSPGSTDTDMLRMLWKDDSGEEEFIRGVPESYRLGIPLKKIATPQEIANTVLFLVSDHSSHITMQNICVDGGATLGIS
ncbi:2,3-dihydro-2,3-dihydroxybenzoate dehydrogenase [Neobacillus sedimentimangrovi]|uniref:2,3-dihydro-2,3-dihydroxybenzoate dehydrogenase n=1 Tax=Neobacillus sedimentimangrovi TaxID=2699460 RepID=A0ABS8QJV6_9BACI|nr:2,3-dihydro-2,3-dihydroxybenzoate dehydrogenase [Neobacillus sedimentimangrovi]MCD4839433.1 2,3-dihydro-2,3-dihydroxybenzoate dehydrogenase [Neobacillus sedimentimangrovi]